MESKTSKDGCSVSLLPPSFEESCTYTVAQTACCADGSLQEKPPLTDVPLNSEQLAMMYNRQVPPPYEADPSQQSVWSTEASKVHPGRPRIVGRDNRRLNTICCRLIVLVGAIAGVYFCFKGLSSIVANYDTARKIHLAQYEAEQAVNVVLDPYNIPAEYEGKLIHVIGPLSVTEPLQYAECDVSAQSVLLRRTFDRSHIYTRVAYDKPYFLSEKWSATRIGEDQICPRPGPEYASSFSLESEVQLADEVKIGPLTLGHRLKEKFDNFAVISDKLLEVGPEQAIRVMYSDAGRSGNVHSVLGKLVDGTIEPFESLDYYKIILQREFEVSAYEMIRDRVNYRLKELDEEDLWSYMAIGLGLLIPLIAMLHYAAVLKAMKKNKRNQVMLSMPEQ